MYDKDPSLSLPIRMMMICMCTGVCIALLRCSISSYFDDDDYVDDNELDSKRLF